jgi:hypothetical protein
MTRKLKIIDFSDKSQVFGILEFNQTIIGRDPGGAGIAIPKNSISREHGQFVKFRNHWCYKDNNSTNGSWINSKKLNKNSWSVIRAGKVLQLADHAVTFENIQDDSVNQKASLKNIANLGGRSLLVFRDGEFVEEYPIPEYGTALIVGGRDATLNIRGDAGDANSLVIVRKGDSVIFDNPSKVYKINHNENNNVSEGSLSDGDNLYLNEYQIIFNDPSVECETTIADSGQMTSFLGWDDKLPDEVGAKTELKKTLAFGTVVDNPDEKYEELEEYFVVEVIPRGYIKVLEKLGYEGIANMTWNEIAQMGSELLNQNEETN